MIDSFFRSSYQKWVISPLLKLKVLLTCSPHLLTFLAAVFGVWIPVLLYLNHSYWAFTCLVLSGFLDTLDGSLARKRGVDSTKGAVLDIVSDRFVEFCILLGLFLVDPIGRGLPTILMLGSVLLCITSFLVVGVFQKNESEKSFHYSAGLMERAEAFIFFGLMILFPSLFTPLAYLFAGLVFLTALARSFHFIKES